MIQTMNLNSIFSTFSTHRSISFLFVSFLFVLTTGFSNVISQNDQANLKVGVVDIQEVYNSYDRAEDFTQQIQDKKEEAQNEIKDLNEQMKQVREELNDIEPLSDLWKKRAKKFYQLKSERQMMQDIWKQDTQKLLSQTSTKIYEEIRKVVEDYGEKNNFDLILKANKSPIGSGNISDINQRIASRSVLHFKNKMDLTDKITTILNEEYNKGSEGSSTNKSGASSSDK